MNGVGLPGRLGPNFLADRVTGPLNLIAIFAGISSLIMYCWTALNSVPGVWLLLASTAPVRQACSRYSLQQ